MRRLSLLTDLEIMGSSPFSHLTRTLCFLRPNVMWTVLLLPPSVSYMVLSRI